MEISEAEDREEVRASVQRRSPEGNEGEEEIATQQVARRHTSPTRSNPRAILEKEKRIKRKEGKKVGHQVVTRTSPLMVAGGLQHLTWRHVVLTAASVCVCAGWRRSFVDSGGHSKTLKRHDTDIHNPGHPAISEKEDDGSSRGWGGDDGQWRGGGDHA